MDDGGFLGSFLSYVLAAAALCGVAGFLMLDRVGKGRTGVLLGAMLGPIGLGIAAVMRGNALRAEDARLHGLSLLPPSAPSPAHADVDALERLAKLREAGHLTDEEFQAKKHEILAGGAGNLEPARRGTRTH